MAIHSFLIREIIDLSIFWDWFGWMTYRGQVILNPEYILLIWAASMPCGITVLPTLQHSPSLCLPPDQLSVHVGHTSLGLLAKKAERVTSRYTLRAYRSYANRDMLLYFVSRPVLLAEESWMSRQARLGRRPTTAAREMEKRWEAGSQGARMMFITMHHGIVWWRFSPILWFL